MIQVVACYCMVYVFKASLCNQFSIIVGHLVYQHMRLRIHALAYSMQIHDFVVIHLSSQNICVTADNLNTCIHLLRVCSFSRVNQRIAC